MGLSKEEEIFYANILKKVGTKGISQSVNELISFIDVTLSKSVQFGVLSINDIKKAFQAAIRGVEYAEQKGFGEKGEAANLISKLKPITDILREGKSDTGKIEAKKTIANGIFSSAMMNGNGENHSSAKERPPRGQSPGPSRPSGRAQDPEPYTEVGTVSGGWRDIIISHPILFLLFLLFFVTFLFTFTAVQMTAGTTALLAAPLVPLYHVHPAQLGAEEIQWDPEPLDIDGEPEGIEEEPEEKPEEKKLSHTTKDETRIKKGTQVYANVNGTDITIGVKGNKIEVYGRLLIKGSVATVDQFDKVKDEIEDFNNGKPREVLVDDDFQMITKNEWEGIKDRTERGSYEPIEVRQHIKVVKKYKDSNKTYPLKIVGKEFERARKLGSTFGVYLEKRPMLEWITNFDLADILKMPKIIPSEVAKMFTGQYLWDFMGLEPTWFHTSNLSWISATSSALRLAAHAINGIIFSSETLEHFLAFGHLGETRIRPVFRRASQVGMTINLVELAHHIFNYYVEDTFTSKFYGILPEGWGVVAIGSILSPFIYQFGPYIILDKLGGLGQVFLNALFAQKSKKLSKPKRREIRGTSPIRRKTKTTEVTEYY